MSSDYRGQLASRTKPLENGCWEFTGFVDHRSGYGFFGKKNIRAHRLAWEVARGPIPDGSVIDHICHNLDLSCAGGPSCLHRRCVNPDHMEVVERGLNVLRGRGVTAAHARKTHCKSGHEFTAENTRITKRGHRVCRTCRQRYNREEAARRRAVVR